MDIKILLKAMSYMFLPTLAVLVMLLVGFFDPVAMWEFIKSNNCWAIAIRVFIFIVEIVCVLYLYDKYETEDNLIRIKNADYSDVNATSGRRRDYSTYLRDLQSEWKSDDSYYEHSTNDKNVKIVVRVPKNE